MRLNKAEVYKVNDAATILPKEAPICATITLRILMLQVGPMTKVYTVNHGFCSAKHCQQQVSYEYIALFSNGPLPSKPIEITFDDTRGYTIAPEMEKYGLKAFSLL
jgi:hypothetical protein